MEKILDYKKLYDIQDKVLSVIFSLENEFYLTGGTALHRFYYGARYSDDLDIFETFGENFNENVKEAMLELEKDFKVKTEVTSKDFYRIIIEDILQIDFVNDRVYRYKKSNIFNNIRVDNKLNILTNKVNTIINRDEEKDVFDLFCLAFHEEFNWEEVLKIANEKAVIQKDILIYRLKTFPLDWLKNIKKTKDINITQNDIEIMCKDIIDTKYNSLSISN